MFVIWGLGKLASIFFRYRPCLSKTLGGRGRLAKGEHGVSRSSPSENGPGAPTPKCLQAGQEFARRVISLGAHLVRAKRDRSRDNLNWNQLTALCALCTAWPRAASMLIHLITSALSCCVDGSLKARHFHRRLFCCGA